MTMNTMKTMKKSLYTRLKEEGIEAGIGTNSNILAAIGRSKAESAESVSFSLKAGTTMEDADKIVDSLKEIVTGERTVL